MTVRFWEFYSIRKNIIPYNIPWESRMVLIIVKYGYILPMCIFATKANENVLELGSLVFFLAGWWENFKVSCFFFPFLTSTWCFECPTFPFTRLLWYLLFDRTPRLRREREVTVSMSIPGRFSRSERDPSNVESLKTPRKFRGNESTNFIERLDRRWTIGSFLLMRMWLARSSWSVVSSRFSIITGPL